MTKPRVYLFFDSAEEGTGDAPHVADAPPFLIVFGGGDEDLSSAGHRTIVAREHRIYPFFPDDEGDEP